MGLHGVIFDLDGVLCDSEPFLAQAAIQMFKQVHDVQVKVQDFAPYIGTGEDNYLSGVAKKYNVRLRLPDDKLTTYEYYLQVIRGKLQPIPGAIAFINACMARNFRIGVATSTDRMKLEGNLRELGLPPDKFHAVVTGSDVKRKKPDPDIYQRVIEKLGLPAKECLVLEDSPNGVAAATAAGAHCLGITTSFDEHTLRQRGAQWTAPDLAHTPEQAVTW